MTAPLNAYELEQLLYFLKGDKHALLLCLDMVWCGHYFDDLIDQDNPRTPEDAKTAFLKVFRGIPDNPFFKRWQPYLQPLLMNTAQLYIDSTNLEFGDPDERLMAFILRNQSLAFINHCIYCAGIADDDPEWVSKVSTDFWKLFKLTDKLRFFILEEGPDVEAEGD